MREDSDAARKDENDGMREDSAAAREGASDAEKEDTGHAIGMRSAIGAFVMREIAHAA